jgi:sugar (pentulose or hexulose) kinase
MYTLPVIAIFDVGKTNKKLFLFDRNYKIVYERAVRLAETTDDDGDPCEDVNGLRLTVFDLLREVFMQKKFEIKALNFSSYGASFVYLDEERQTAAPLYNYLKEYPEVLKQKFYDSYGGAEAFSYHTASPVLGSLNSGMQLYRIKYEKPQLFRQIKYALHLPQYLSFLISGNVFSDITSIGCHTNLWDFAKNEYHYWVKQEGLLEKLAPLRSGDTVIPALFPGNNYAVGIGLHDSSAALIPYLVNFSEPFILISTGTWNISLNPFNDSPLTKEELENDCLCYMSYLGKPVKASRLFAGYEHEQQVKRIGEHFHQNAGRYREMEYNPKVIARLRDTEEFQNMPDDKNKPNTFDFRFRQPGDFTNDEEAYHRLLLDIVAQQYASTQMVLKGTGVKRIFVDGGFSKNVIYMNLLANFFPGIEIFAASVAQATALGAALAIHHCWNPGIIPDDTIELTYYSPAGYDVS